MEISLSVFDNNKYKAVMMQSRIFFFSCVKIFKIYKIKHVGGIHALLPAVQAGVRPKPAKYFKNTKN